MPSSNDMQHIVRACCRVNATLYVLGTNRGSWGFKESNCSRTHLADDQAIRTDKDAHEPLALCNFTPSARQATGASLGHLVPLQDETGQRRHYESARLLELIDVGILWRPGNQKGSATAVLNRPPTRMHWWWSHGIPVIGYPMEAYLDAGRRVGYPLELLNLTKSRHIEEALRRLAPPEERSCLQARARRGAALSSPSYSAIELLATICAVAERCGATIEAGRLLQPSSHWARRLSTRHAARTMLLTATSG